MKKNLSGFDNKIAQKKGKYGATKLDLLSY
jgi:hypothetical protein